MDARISSESLAASRAGSFPHFDWLRFVLASAVVLDHSGWHLGISGLAVQTFFALSGWLIGGILLKTERQELPHFFYNRATRIWIPYATAVAALYGLAGLRDGFTPGYFRYLFHDLTFTHTWFIALSEAPRMPLEGTGGHFWSISAEEQFYLAAPLMMVMYGWGKRLLPWLAIGAIAFATAWWWSAYVSIVFGVVAATLHRDVGNWHTATRPRIVLFAVATSSLTVILAGGFLVGGVYNVLSPIFAVSVVLLTAVEGTRNRIAQELGGLSYPLYLNHWIGIFAANFLVKFIPLPLPLRVTLSYAVAVAVAYFAYKTVDEQVLKRRRRLYTPARGKGLMLTAYGLCGIGVAVGIAG